MIALEKFIQELPYIKGNNKYYKWELQFTIKIVNLTKSCCLMKN